jgi:hypothetical protein
MSSNILETSTLNLWEKNPKTEKKEIKTKISNR